MEVNKVRIAIIINKKNSSSVQLHGLPPVKRWYFFTINWLKWQTIIDVCRYIEGSTRRERDTCLGYSVYIVRLMGGVIRLAGSCSWSSWTRELAELDQPVG
jgi:hypothetical protein